MPSLCCQYLTTLFIGEICFTLSVRAARPQNPRLVIDQNPDRTKALVVKGSPHDSMDKEADNVIIIVSMREKLLLNDRELMEMALKPRKA